jgi:hypothetical protein
VSCTSAKFCEAVGYYYPKGYAGAALIEAWNGTSWTTQSVPSPTGSTQSPLDGVSCVSTTFCEAVGRYETTGELPLAEVWDGTSWAIQATPNPSGSIDTYLSAVSCPSSASCEAVGSYAATGQLTLAEVWNGKSWAIQSTPNPTGAISGVLDAVSCPSATLCEAVGWYQGSAKKQHYLAEGWNATSWTVQPTPNPSGSNPSYLADVSCASATSCKAAGSDRDPSGNVATSAEAWNGTSWKAQKTAIPSTSAPGVLVAVSCTGPTFCESVGYYQSSSFKGVALAELWNGTKWRLQPIPSPGGSYLVGVSCASATFCEAVGVDNNKAFAEGWNGSSWSIQSTPNPATATSAGLGAVSCPSVTFCEAVGWYQVARKRRGTLAEVWQGTSWAIQSTPNPTGSRWAELDAVSCISARFCEAGGDYSSAIYAQAPVAEGWNGTSWAVQSAGSAGTAGSLLGVSCTSTTFCEAVGDGLNVEMAEVWNGTSWAIQSTPPPAGSTQSYLYGVSCKATNACEAVGLYFNSSAVEVTLANGWDGIAWTLQSTPNPTGTTRSDLFGVSCISVASCDAAGDYTGTKAGGTLILAGG